MAYFFHEHWDSFDCALDTRVYPILIAKLCNEVPSLSLSRWRTLTLEKKKDRLGAMMYQTSDKSAADNGTVNQCTADYCLKFETS